MELVKIDEHNHKVIRQIIRYPNGYVEHSRCPICNKIVKTAVYVKSMGEWKKEEGVDDIQC